MIQLNRTMNTHRRLYSKAFGWLALAACAATLALAPVSAQAQDSLTPDQKTRLRTVMHEAQKDTKEMYDRLRQARQQLSRLYDSYELDERRINETTRWINRVQSEILQRHLRTQRDIRRIVTPAQFEELKKAMKSMREREHRGRDRHRPRGPR